MSDAPTPVVEAPAQGAVRARLGTAAWILSSLLVVLLVSGFWLRVRDQRAASDLAARIATGDRPAAPALPATPLTGDGAPGLPAWYARKGDQQLGGVAGGEVLVVNFWASWCGPCKQEAPELKELAKRYEGRAVVVGLDNQDLASDARAFVREYEIDFPIVRATRADKDAWGVGGFPETFVVGTDGRISAHVDGPIDVDTLRAAIDAELARGGDA